MNIMKSKCIRIKQEKGFTLIELLIVIAIGSVVTGSSYIFFTSQSKSVAIQMKQADIQQNLRAAMFILEQEIKKIGYNPCQIKGEAAPCVISAGQGWLSFQADLNENGAGFNGVGGVSSVIINNDDDPGEIISVGLKKDSYGKGDEDGDGIADSFPSRLWKDTASQNLVIANNIEVVNFEYLDNTGTVIQKPSEETHRIKNVQVTMIARAGTITGGYKNNRSYYNARGIKIFTAPGDSFLRGIIAKTIHCRNLEM